MLRHIVTAAAIAVSAPALADIVQVEADGDVRTVVQRLEDAVNNAGANVFAKVPHSAGAANVGMELEDAELLIFGNPQLGTPALQDDIHAGLQLPLRVLVYAGEDGKTYLAYEEVETMFSGLNISMDAEYVGKMKGALANLTKAASGM